MRLTFLGTGSAFPSPNRVQTSLLVETADHTLLVDCGSGATHRLAQTDTSHNEIDAVLFTHTHLDHVADFSTLVKARWLDDNPELAVYGPPGTATVCDTLLGVDNLTERADLTVTELPDNQTAFDLGPHHIAYTETTHSAHCFAYCLDDSLTISGDTAPNEAVFDLADDSEVLVHECSFPDGTDTAGHTTPTELGAGLSEISVGAVYLTHLFPETESHVQDIETTVASRTEASVTVPEDRDSIEIDQH